MLNKPMFFAVVPWWLAQRIEQDPKIKEALTSYDKLDSILSSDDVAFYHAWQVKRDVFCEGDLFADLQPIYKRPENQMWVATNEANVNNVMSIMNVALERHKADLTVPAVPLTVRKTAFEPELLEQDCLVLMGTRVEAPSILELCERSIKALSKTLGQEDYTQLNVFKRFVIA